VKSDCDEARSFFVSEVRLMLLRLRSPICESSSFDFRAEFFNLFNHPNFANPISNLNALFTSRGRIDPTTGLVLNAGNSGRIISASNNP
jgi:hypothetical protein